MASRYGDSCLVVTANDLSFLQDVMAFEMQDYDPTEDYMLALRKPASSAQESTTQEYDTVLKDWKTKHKPRDSTMSDYGFCEWSIVECAQLLGRFLDKEPWYRFPYMGWLGFYWRSLVRASVFSRDIIAYSLSRGVLQRIVSAIEG